MNLLIEWLKFEEGFRERPYRDSRGVLTVGYGRNLQAHPLPGRDFVTRPYTEEEATTWLRKQATDIYFELRDALPAIEEIDTARSAALVVLAYQLGMAGMRAFRKLWLAVDGRNWGDAALQVLDSRLARQTPNRARRVAEALKTGEWPQEVLA